MLTQEMSTDLVIQHTDHAAFPVLTRQFDVHLAFTCLRIVRY